MSTRVCIWFNRIERQTKSKLKANETEKRKPTHLCNWHIDHFHLWLNLSVSVFLASLFFLLFSFVLYLLELTTKTFEMSNDHFISCSCRISLSLWRFHFFVLRLVFRFLSIFIWCHLTLFYYIFFSPSQPIFLSSLCWFSIRCVWFSRLGNKLKRDTKKVFTKRIVYVSYTIIISVYLLIVLLVPLHE